VVCRLIGRFKLLLFLSLLIDYSAIFFLLLIWQNLVWVYLLSVLVGFCFGLVVLRGEDFIVLWVLSYFGASFLAVLLYVSPSLYPTVVWLKVELGALGAASVLAYNSIFIVPMSICSGFFGLYLGDKYFRRFKSRLFV